MSPLDPIIYAKTPGRFGEEVLAHLRSHRAFRCVVDEIQKLPVLLDEIHGVIESTPVKFVLTGSSSRKLDHHPRVPAFVLCAAQRERLLAHDILAVPWETFVTETLATL